MSTSQMNVAVTQYQPAQPKPRQSDAVHIVVIRNFGDMISNCNCGLIIVLFSAYSGLYAGYSSEKTKPPLFARPPRPPRWLHFS